MFRAGIADVLGIVNIADITDVADISTDIADIGMDIADIVMGIADVVDSADIADWMLRTLRWKQVDAYKVSQGCPVTLGVTLFMYNRHPIISLNEYIFKVIKFDA